VEQSDSCDFAINQKLSIRMVAGFDHSRKENSMNNVREKNKRLGKPRTAIRHGADPKRGFR